MYHESWQSRLLYWGGARLPCLHIIAGTDQTLRFITQSNLKPFTKKHAETPGAHVRLLGVQREGRNSPMESKGLKCEDYQPHPEDQTELMLTFKLSPSLHLLFIPFHLESKVCFPYSADVESYRPHLDIISKLEEGWWQRRDEGAQRAGLLGLVVKRGLGG